MNNAIHNLYQILMFVNLYGIISIESLLKTINL